MKFCKFIFELLKISAALFLFTSPVSAEPLAVSLAPFYADLQQKTPHGRLGEVIKKERVVTTVPGAQAWRIAYISSDVLERKTITTAIIVAPKGKISAYGRPIISWAHGTTGTAENCGPSQVENPAQDLNQYFLANGNSWTDYGLPALTTFIKQGYVVVGTDYQGLGGGGKHQYTVSATQGRDVINAIRAVRFLKLSGGNKKAVVYGWSQGGGATLAAASLSNYIARKDTASDNIDIIGFVAMAPPDLASLAPKEGLDDNASQKLMENFIAAFSNNIFDFSHLSMNLWANAISFPTLQLTDIYTEEGARFINDIMSRKCMHVASDTLNYTFASTYKNILRERPLNSRAWAQALVDGGIAATKPVAPVIIYWGTKDTVVPPTMGKLYQERMCALGGNITRVKLAGEQTHFSTPSASEPLYVSWIKERVNNAPLANGCYATTD